MAVSKVIHRWAYPVREALGNLSEEEKQWHFVKINTDSTLSLATSADEVAFVLEDTPKWEQNGSIALVGVPKVRVAEEIKAGQPVSCNSEGKAVVATTGQYIQGFAVHTAKSGTLCPILVSPLGAKQ